MPFGQPQGPGGHQYQLTFRSVAQVDGYPVTFQVTASTEYLGNARVAEVVQAFTDVVHAHPDFILVSGTRSTSYTETITAGVA